MAQLLNSSSQTLRRLFVTHCCSVSIVHLIAQLLHLNMHDFCGMQDKQRRESQQSITTGGNPQSGRIKQCAPVEQDLPCLGRGKCICVVQPWRRHPKDAVGSRVQPMWAEPKASCPEVWPEQIPVELILRGVKQILRIH